MGVILKHSIRNIISKPLRLIVLIVCITMASFAALLALDMSNNIISLMNGYLMKIMGSVNVYAIGADEDEIDGVEKIADMTYFGVGVARDVVYAPDPTDYHYVEENRFMLYSFSSAEAACEMKMFKNSLTLDDSTAIASPEFMEMFDKQIGDTVTVNTADGSKIDLVISDVYEVDSEFMSREALIVTENTLQRINCISEISHDIWFFYVKDESKITDVYDYLCLKAPKATVVDLYTAVQDEDFIQSITGMFYLIFLVTVLLVTFISISMSEKIVNERMSVIGTLRSLGVRPRKTALILLVENALYAVIGAAIGTVVYLIVKVPFLNMFVIFTDSSNEQLDLSMYYDKTPVLLCVAVFIGAILLECAYPLYELLKAVKTPIRDIIFNNKDTEFKYTWRRLYIGCGLLLISVVTAFMVKSFAILCVSLAAGAIAMAVLLPYVIRFFSRLLTALFRRVKMPIAQLASENISRNKSIMGNAVLSVMSILLTTLILAVSGPVWKWLTPESLPYDVSAYITVRDDTDYSYFKNVDGVKDMDILHMYGCYAVINPEQYQDDDSKPVSVCSDEPHTLADYLPHEAYGLSSDEIVLSKEFAKAYDVNVGDKVEVLFNSKTKFPNIITFTVVDIYNPYDLVPGEVPSETVVAIVNSELYERIFFNNVDRVLFTTDDPEALQRELKNSTDSESVIVETKDKILQDNAENAQGLRALLSFIIFGSSILTLIGITGNQTFSFITRKRETALLYSVAMGRKKIKRLLFLESLFSIGTTTLIALPAAPVFFYTLSHIMTTLSEGEVDILQPNMVNIGSIILFIFIVSAVYILAVLSPFRALRKMNISEELKYE